MTDKKITGKTDSALSELDFMEDLILVVLWLTASAAVIYIPVLNATPLRYVVTIPFLLVIPGYCLIAALFPAKDDLSLPERIALSFGFSFVIIPIIGLGLNFTPWGIRLDPIVLSLNTFTFIFVAIAYFRRRVLRNEDRFRVSFSRIAQTIRPGIFPAERTRFDLLLNGILATVIIIALAISVSVIAFPREGEHFSEFFLLGENGMAADYPSLILTGLQYPLSVGIGNHEYRTVSYTVEIWNMEIENDTITNTTTIKTMDPLDHQTLVLPHNDTAILPYNLVERKTGYNRVEFLLFNETIPGPDVKGSDRINASYRSLNLWITVQ